MALTRITKGVIKPNENYDTHDINSTGIVTAVGLDINGNADISGNFSVGGVLTYEDVTSIDSVGIITAQKDIHVGAGVSAVGVGTFGSLDIGGDIDVDGHTNLDNLSVAGVSTFTGNIFATGTFKFSKNGSESFEFDSGGNLLLNTVTPRIQLNDINSENDYQIMNGDGTFVIRDLDRSVSFYSVSSAGQQTFTGNVVLNNDLDVDGHTNLDNVSIAGVVTTTSDIKVGTGVTLNVYGGATFSGIVTASSYRGDGSQLTGITGTTINSNADNRIITGSGTANTLNGESTLTYSGDTLLSTNSNFVIKSIDTNASNSENYIQFNAGYITYDSDASNSTGYSGHYFQADGSEVLRINGSGQLVFNADTNTYIARPAADTLAFTTNGSERLRITSGGSVNIGGDFSQSSHKLSVYEATNTAGMKVKAGTSSDQTADIWCYNDQNNWLALGVWGSGATTSGLITANDAIVGANNNLSLYSTKSDGIIKFGAGSGYPELMRLTSAGVISFDKGTTPTITPSQTTSTSVGHQTMSGGSTWFNHGTSTDYFGVDGDWKLTNGATYGKIVARNTQGAINNATQAGHTWFLVCKTVAGTLGNSNWVVEPVAGWKMAWPVPLIAGGVATFYMRDAVESFGSPTIPASGDYYIGWFYSVSQQMGTNGGSYYVDNTSGGKIYYYSGEGDMSNPHQRIPRQGDSWDDTMTGEKIHFRYETLPKADLTGTVFASPLLVDPVMEGVPLIDGLPMAGGQLVKDVQWSTNVSSVEFQNADFVNCNYLVTYSINGSDGSNDTSGWYQTRLQFCDHDGTFFTGTNDYISHCEWNHSTGTSPSINSSFAGYQRSIWLTGNGSNYDHEGYVWIIPSNFRHNQNATISQRWGNGTEYTALTHPRIFVRGHSHLSAGVDTAHYREEGGGTYRGTNGIFRISGFRLYGSANSNLHTPASNGSSNGYVRIWRFRSGFETRE